LGLNAYHGDSAACIYKDGEIIAASEEERFRRIKHWAGFPTMAIDFCLQEAGISIQEVDFIAVSRDPKANFFRKVFTAFKNRLSLKNMLNRAQNLKKASSIEHEICQHFNLANQSLKAKVVNVEHHRSHLASAFFASAFDESAILSIDGFGDFSSTMLAIGKGNQIEVLDTVSYPHSLGLFYTTLTQFLGFPHYGDEYKVMGLAPYGVPKYAQKIRTLIQLKPNGLFELNLKYFNHPKNGVKMAWEDGVPSIESLFTKSLTDLLGLPRQSDEALKSLAEQIRSPSQLSQPGMLAKIIKDSGVLFESKIAHGSNSTQTNMNTNGGSNTVTTLSQEVKQDLKGSLLNLLSKATQDLDGQNKTSTSEAIQRLVQQFGSVGTSSGPSIFNTKIDVPANLNILLQQLLIKPTRELSDKELRTQLLVLLQQHTVSSLAKIQLQQLHSVNHELETKDSNQATSSWLFEVPVKHQNEIHQLNLRIDREWVDEKNENSEDKTSTKIKQWSVMLRFDLPKLGEFCAQLAIVEDN
ncbi:MAG: hypothetical protein EOP55_20120, partial [Sphingobacteriales bacterium]